MKFTELNELNVHGNVIGCLTPVVDCIRDLKTQLGARPYQVSLIWTRWTGGERGIGNEFVVSQEHILPTPNIINLANIRTDLVAIGTLEAGTIQITEISPRYTEQYLNGLYNPAILIDGEIPIDISVYWEVWYPSNSERRRFISNSAVRKNPTKFQWEVNLVRAYEDRTIYGDPR